MVRVSAVRSLVTQLWRLLEKERVAARSFKRWEIYLGLCLPWAL